jgi:hypothetical protein
METLPKIGPLLPSVEGRQPLRLAIEANKLPTGGLMALLALIKSALLRLFTLPSVSHLGLSSLSSLSSHIFYRRGSKLVKPGPTQEWRRLFVCSQ